MICEKKGTERGESFLYLPCAIAIYNKLHRCGLR